MRVVLLHLYTASAARFGSAALLGEFFIKIGLVAVPALIRLLNTVSFCHIVLPSSSFKGFARGDLVHELYSVAQPPHDIGAKHH